MSEVEWWEFDSAAEMAQQAAGDIGFVIESAIEAHGGARLAVSAGPASRLVWKELLGQGIDWSKVTILPTDDRLVRSSDPLSNFAPLSAAFAAKGATVVPLVDEAMLDDYREAGRRADERLGTLDWPLDLACLEVGEKGDTAGILEGPDLDRALAGPRGRRAVGLHPDPMPGDAPVDRVTLTADALASARTVMLVTRGGEARATLEQSIEEGPLSSKPIGRILAALDADVDILWSAG
ncbi:MAG: 6-phosphogluconolactonase [Sphingomonadales bacterium]